MIIVSKLINGVAKVNFKYKEITALAAACYFGHVDVVQELINLKVGFNQGVTVRHR